MKIYLVGGAVRDRLLGLPIKEKDWVVVGVTVEQMLAQGYRQVGKDFPVFLHPETQEEYALARIERKIGKGYTGFAFDASAKVTLEDDLKRRDLTINAIAQDADGVLIDPYQGQQDLRNKILRHVSPAFVEDPVRILRVARFAARFPDFVVARETNDLMHQMVMNGEVDALVAERVWKEFERALAESHPERFFQILEACGALAVLFPPHLDIEKLKNVSTPLLRFALLTHTLSETELKNFCDRYRVPNDYRELALLIIRYQNIELHDAEVIVQLLNAVDAFRRAERFKIFLKAWEGLNKDPRLAKYYDAASKIEVKPFIDQGLAGKEIAKQLDNARKEAVRVLLRGHC